MTQAFVFSVKHKVRTLEALWTSVTHTGLIFGFLSFFNDIALISDITTLT